MNLLKHRSMRFYLVFFLILTMAIGGSAIAAFADSTTGATVAVNAGSLSETGDSSVTANPVTLSGDDQTTSYSIGLTVIDATGSAAGWNLTISATQFTGTANHVLPSNASYIDTAPTATCASNGGNCTLPNNSASYPLTVTTSAQKFFNAAANTGLGKFTIPTAVKVSIPANTIADTYSSTVSVAIVSGP